AAAADALQDVLDVVREGGDGLAHGRQAFGLQQGGVIRRVFHGECRLVADGDHQLQVFLGEFVDVPLVRGAAGGGVGVDVDHPDDAVATLHGDGDRLAHAERDDAAGRVPTFVVAGVAGEHPLFVLH